LAYGSSPFLFFSGESCDQDDYITLFTACSCPSLSFSPPFKRRHLNRDLLFSLPFFFFSLLCLLEQANHCAENAPGQRLDFRSPFPSSPFPLLSIIESHRWKRISPSIGRGLSPSPLYSCPLFSPPFPLPVAMRSRGAKSLFGEA